MVLYQNSLCYIYHKILQGLKIAFVCLLFQDDFRND